MAKKVTGSQITMAIGEGTEIPYTPERVRAEMAALAEFIINAGPVGAVGQHGKVLGLRGVFTYAMSVDAPDEAWATLDKMTVPAEAEVEPPNQPKQPNRKERRAAEKAGLKWNTPVN